MPSFRPKRTYTAPRVLLALGLLAIVFASSAQAQTTVRLVDQNNVDCRDVQNSIVYCTVQAAINFAQPNDTIQLVNGPYQENISVAGTQTVTIAGDGNGLGAPNGSVITVGPGAQLVVDNLVVTGGVSGRGGGVNNAGTLIMRNSIVTANSAEDGGGIWHEGGTLSLSNVTISANTASGNGGGLALVAGQLSLSGVTLDGNQAAGSGGGLWYGGIDDLTLGGIIVSNNSAGGNGGGIAIQAIESVAHTQPANAVVVPTASDRSTFRARRQTAPGGSISGQIWLDDNEDGAFQAGQELGIGGVTLELIRDLNQDGLPGADEELVAQTITTADGSYLFSELPIDTDYVVVVTDTASVLSGFSLTSSASSPYAVALSAENPTNTSANFGYKAGRTQITIDAIALSGNSAVNGGGLWIASGVVSAEGLTISDNSAAGNGAGIGIGGGMLRIVNGTFVGNQAARDGGGIYAENGILVTRNATFNANTARNGGAAWYFGGLGLMSGNTVTGNEALGAAGGVGVGQGVLSLVGGTISANRAGNLGGGAAVEQPGNAVLQDVALSNNEAGGAGGGAGGGLWNAGTSTLSNSEVSNNVSGGTGGGIHNTGTLLLLSTPVTDNEAESEGGGLWNDGVSQLTDGGIAGNLATNAGGGVRNFGAITFERTPVRGNETEGLGGGIANGSFSSGGTIVIGASEVVENVARVGGGIYNEGSVWQAQLNGQPIPLVANVHKLLYGFFRLVGEGSYGVVDMTGTSVINNEATVAGGGVFNEQGQVNTNFAEISDNGAQLYGGGIVNNGMADLDRSIVIGNVTQGFGGGIVNAGGLVLSDSVVGNNVAGGPGGGVLNLGLLNLKGNVIAFNLGAGGADCMALVPLTVYGENTIEDQDGCEAVRALGDID